MKTVKFKEVMNTTLAKYEVNPEVESIIVKEMQDIIIEDVKRRTGNQVYALNVYLGTKEKDCFVPNGLAGNSVYCTCVFDGKWYLYRKDYERVEE